MGNYDLQAKGVQTEVPENANPEPVKGSNEEKACGLPVIEANSSVKGTSEPGTCSLEADVAHVAVRAPVLAVRDELGDCVAKTLSQRTACERPGVCKLMFPVFREHVVKMLTQSGWVVNGHEVIGRCLNGCVGETLQLSEICD